MSPSKDREGITRAYQARSAFFYRRLVEMRLLDLAQKIDRLDQEMAEALDWRDLWCLGISSAAWDRVIREGLPRLRYFCHPEVLMADPTLIAYYRMIAALSQKAVSYIAFNTTRLEEGSRRELSLAKAEQLARLFNSTMDHLFSARFPSLQELQGLLFLTAGTQIDGSWRNQIGQGAERTVRRLLVGHFSETGHLRCTVRRRDNREIPVDNVAALLADIGQYSACVLSNGAQIVFGSEPDITLVNPAGEVAGAIEVKGGTDPAGALERLGAAGKSFENTLEENPSARTIYLAGVITPEAENRLQRDRRFRSYHDLKEVLTNEVERRGFLDEVGRLLWILPTSATE